jgi:hypothetical protein
VQEQPDRLTNAVIAIAQDGWLIIYRQQQPIPFVMWRPWEENGSNSFAASQSPAGLPQVDGRATAFLVCYEHLISLPFLKQAAGHPQQVVAIASTWFSPPYIRLAQARAVEAWAGLFGIPAVTAFNG